MSSDPQHFAQVVLSAFKAAGHHTDDHISDAGGPSDTYMTMLRKVAAGSLTDMRKPRNDTLSRIDKAAQWWADAARQLWETGVEPRTTWEHPAFDGMKLERVTGEDARGLRMEGRDLRDDAKVHGPEEAIRRLEVKRTSRRLTDLEERLDIIEQMLATQLSDPTPRTDLAVAADDQEQSIAGEQESPDTP